MKITSKDKEILFEQYKLYVEGMEKVSDRRMVANNYFLTINTAIISLTGLLFNLKSTFINLCYTQIVGFIGIVICIIWFLIVLSYKQLNTGKFKIIHEIEKNLPIQLYSSEWKVLGEGKSIKKYMPFSHIEAWIPFAFVVIYIMLLVISGNSCSLINISK